MGTPIRHSLFMQCLSGLLYCFPTWIIGNFFITTITHSMPEISCDSTVARAAPETPDLKTTMNRRSSPMFKKDDMIRKTRGVLLSPMALIMLERILYRKVAGIPINMISIYE